MFTHHQETFSYHFPSPFGLNIMDPTIDLAFPPYKKVMPNHSDCANTQTKKTKTKKMLH